MFKKIAHTGLILILAFAGMGFSVSQHYCGDRLVSVSVNGSAEPCCGPEGKCCQNKIIHLQLDDDYVVQASLISESGSGQNIFNYPVSTISPPESILKINRTYKFCDSSPPKDLPTQLASLQTYLL